jgi:hypothetical protein
VHGPVADDAPQRPTPRIITPGKARAAPGRTRTGGGFRFTTASATCTYNPQYRNGGVTSGLHSPPIPQEDGYRSEWEDERWNAELRPPASGGTRAREELSVCAILLPHKKKTPAVDRRVFIFRIQRAFAL